MIIQKLCGGGETISNSESGTDDVANYSKR